MSQSRSEEEVSLLPDRAAWMRALDAVAGAGHAALPLLDAAACRSLLAASYGLTYRQARPLVGASGREVRQDFELTMEIPEAHLLRQLAAALEASVTGAAAALRPNPLPQGVRFNDLIVQRYPRHSAGISPHRDHLRYTGLVVLVTLVGRARFFVCKDHSGLDPVEIPTQPGGAVLLTAPGFAGKSARPFHYLTSVEEPRVSLGIRQDSRPGEPL